MKKHFQLFLIVVLALSMTTLVAGEDKKSHHGKNFSVMDIKGSYGFSFQGEIVGVGPVAAIGQFYADGKGNVTEAVRTISVNGVPQTETFTCQLVVNPNGTGTAECPLDDPAPGFPPEEAFDFVLEDNAKQFRMVGTTPGIVVLGAGQKQ